MQELNRNPFIPQLEEAFAERFSIDSVNMTYADWIARNTTMLGRPFSYKGYEFQKQIVNDMSTEMDVIKISQIGITEVQLRKMLAFLKRNRGTKGIFSLPDEAMHEKISVSRLAPILQDSKVFNSRYDQENKVTRTKEIKQFGQSFMFIVPALEKSATSIDADIVMNDEVDLSDQKILGLFTSRLQGSRFKIHQRFSTPTFPGFGIDATFSVSDQHHYMVRCDSCRTWCHPEFNPNFIHIPGLERVMEMEAFKDMSSIDTEMMDMMNVREAYVKCDKCSARLDLDDPGMREWVAMYPSRLSRGYRLTPFVSTALDIPYILKRLQYFKQQDFLRGWYNTVLGLSYSDDSIQLSDAAIQKCFTGNMSAPDASPEDVWVGIDVGQICHIVIGSGPNADQIIELVMCNVRDLESEVERILKKYSVRAGCIDRHPYEPTAAAIYALSGGRIIPTEYRGTKNINIVMNEANPEIANHAQVNRTWFLDQLVNRINRGALTISGYSHLEQMFTQHLRAMARNEEPEKPAEWTKLNKNDHFFHAAAFMINAPMMATVLMLKSDAEERVTTHVSGARFGKPTPTGGTLIGGAMIGGGMSSSSKKPLVRPLGRR